MQITLKEYLQKPARIATSRLFAFDFFKALAKNMKDEHTNESFARASTCLQCEFKKESILSLFINSEIKEINGFSCSLCDCPLATKIFAQDQKNICDKWKQ